VGGMEKRFSLVIKLSFPSFPVILKRPYLYGASFFVREPRKIEKHGYI
jgi:hypothetical protein